MSGKCVRRIYVSVNSLNPGRLGSNFTNALLKLMLHIDTSGTSCEIDRW